MRPSDELKSDRLLGAFLVEGRGDSRQLFIATHSTDILRGVLDANSPAVKVVRICRQGEVNAVRVLDNQRIKELWDDPLLRYSNILDGLFHEVAVICEGDADCRFYSAVLDATKSSADSETRRRDAFFTHCGGKARLPLVVRALREVDVPVRAVADFDILADEQPLRSVVEALSSDWATVESDWRTVKASVDAKRPDLNTTDVKREIDRILGAATSSILPERVRTELQSVLKRSTAWSNAKLVGKSFVPSGDPMRACERLLGALRSFGLHVVEVGELEGFCRTVDGHGPKWVNSVLARDLARDPELASAREFAKRLTGA